MSLFLNLLFETDSYSNEYLLAKFGFDAAENEPLELIDLVYFNLGSEASVLIAPELACLTKAAVKAFSSARRLV